MHPKNKITAALLAFFTGFAGGHKLYLGEKGGFIGFLIMLVFSISLNIPITFFLGLMNGLKLLKMSDQEFNRKYNRGFVPMQKGPLETRRNEQMRRYDQMPDVAQGRKPSPQSALKANPYKNSGIKKYKDFDLEDAIIDFKKGLELAPNDVALHFNIACAYSLTEKKERAYHHLSRAVSLGLQGQEKILSHDDLAYVRIQPEFEAFKTNGFKVNPYHTSTEKTPSFKDQSNPVREQIDTNDNSLLDQLNKLKELKDRGLLSEIEFNFERKKLLRQ